MLIKLTGGKVYDPANKVSGEVRDIYVEDGKIVAARPNARVDHDLRRARAASSWPAPSTRTPISAAAR